MTNSKKYYCWIISSIILVFGGMNLHAIQASTIVTFSKPQSIVENNESLKIVFNGSITNGPNLKSSSEVNWQIQSITIKDKRGNTLGIESIGDKSSSGSIIAWNIDVLGKDASFIFYPKFRGIYNITVATKVQNQLFKNFIELDSRNYDFLSQIPEIEDSMLIESKVTEPGNDDFAQVSVRVSDKPDGVDSSFLYGYGIARLIGSKGQVIGYPSYQNNLNGEKWQSFEIKRMDYLSNKVELEVSYSFAKKNSSYLNWLGSIYKKIPITINFVNKKTIDFPEYEVFYGYDYSKVDKSILIEAYDTKDFSSDEFNLQVAVDWSKVDPDVQTVSKLIEIQEFTGGKYVRKLQLEKLVFERSEPSVMNKLSFKLDNFCNKDCTKKYRIYETITKHTIKEFSLNAKLLKPAPDLPSKQGGVLTINVEAPSVMYNGKSYKITITTTPQMTGACVLGTYNKTEGLTWVRFGEVGINKGRGVYTGKVNFVREGQFRLQANCSGINNKGKRISAGGSTWFSGFRS